MRLLVDVEHIAEQQRRAVNGRLPVDRLLLPDGLEQVRPCAFPQCHLLVHRFHQVLRFVVGAVFGVLLRATYSKTRQDNGRAVSRTSVRTSSDSGRA
jgi:hypothetical protein